MNYLIRCIAKQRKGSICRYLKEEDGLHIVKDLSTGETYKMDKDKLSENFRIDPDLMQADFDNELFSVLVEKLGLVLA